MSVIMSREMLTRWAMSCWICCVLLTGEPCDGAPRVSAALSEKVSNVATKLSSSDIRERLQVLDDLLILVDYGCSSEYRPRYELPREDYLTVVKCILDGDMSGLEPETMSEAFYKTCEIIRTQKLKEMGKPLAGYLRINNPGIQYGILYTVTALNATESIPEVVPLLDSSEEGIRREALRTLVKLHAREAVPYLVQHLQDKDHLVRYHALTDLVAVDGREAAPAITKLIEDPDHSNRYWAADALLKLRAKDHAHVIWKLVGGEEIPSTQSYAIAALVALGQRRAIPMAVARATADDMYVRYTMLESLVRARADAVVPALAQVLKRDLLSGRESTNANVLQDIIYIFRRGRLDGTRAIPVLHQYVRQSKEALLRDVAVEVLGTLKARAAAKDILPLLDVKDAGDIMDTSARAAVALAKIGDKKTWSRLLSFAATPGRPNRSEIISQLNAHLDPQLWRIINTRKVQGVGTVPVNDIVEAFTRESGIHIVLHYRPGDVPTNVVSSRSVWPYAHTSSGRICLIDGLQDLVNALSPLWGPNNPNCIAPCTFVLHDHEIHIMRVTEALQWWKKNVIHARRKSKSRK